MISFPNDIDSVRGLAPFWVINADVNREQIAAGLDAILSKGILEVIVERGHSIAVKHLQDDWLEVLAWCVDEARARSMHIWISHDGDRLAPNGGAEHYRNTDPMCFGKSLAVESKPRDEIDLAFFELGQFLVAGRIQGGLVTKTRLVPDRHVLRALDSSWHIFNCRIRRDADAVDVLSSEAVTRIFERNLERYVPRLGKEFGRTLRAIFATEPCIHLPEIDGWSVPYTEALFESFQERYRYSAIPYIPYLFLSGEAAPAFRADFWEHLARLLHENYHGRLARWCKKNGLLYIACADSRNMNHSPTLLQSDKLTLTGEIDIPAIDHPKKVCHGNPFVTIIEHKRTSSQAHATSKPRVMTKSFGSAGWDTNYLDLKRTVDGQFAVGVNVLAPYALQHTVAGRKRSDEVSFFVQSPLWQDFDAFRAYVERVSSVLGSGKHLCHILIVFPVTGLLATFHPNSKTQEFDRVDSFLNSLCIELTKRQLDYDMTDTSALRSVQAQDGQIALGDERYDMLIVPYTPYMRPHEYEIIGRIAKTVETYFFYRSTDPGYASLPSQSNGVQFVATEDLPGFAMRLRHAIDDGIHLVGAGREDILLLQREVDGKRTAFFASRSGHHRKVAVKFTGQVGLTLMEPETGLTRELRTRKAGRKTEATLQFAPYQSFLVTVHEPAAREREAVANEAPVEVEIENLKVETAENVANLFHFSPTGSGRKLDIRRTAGRTVPANVFGGIYEAEFQNDAPGCRIRMVLDRTYDRCKVFVNDGEVSLSAATNWLTDPLDLEADITELLRPGMNAIRVASDELLSEPIRLAGEFDVELAADLVIVKPCQDRHHLRLEESMPFYSGTVTYTAEFEIDVHGGRVQLDLGEVLDSAAAVYVNKTLSGKRLWPPYQMDITSAVKPGLNNLRIEVRNSLSNLILGVTKAFGLRTKPKMKVSGY
ncbi:MAG: hypothetical protein HYX78_16010 [Armatimonadetes bacterium]|nr:hypothetical protein [Armatimonadota bacterium]